MRLGRHPENTKVLALCISNTPILGIQKHCRLNISCRGMRVWGATPKPHTFGIVHFKYTHTRYPEILWVTYLVKRYARLGRQAKNAHFLAVCSSHTTTQGFQKHSLWHIWGIGMCVWGATRKTHIFGIVHFKHTRTRYPEILLVDDLVHRYARLGRQAKNAHFLALCISDTTIRGI